MVDEPQPVLGERQRHHCRPLDGHQRLEPILIRTKTKGQLGHCGRLEQGAHPKAAVHTGVDCGDEAHRRQRIPAQIEKGVVHPDPLEPEHLRVDAGQDFLGGGARSAVTIGVVVLRNRQGPFVEFAVDGQRQRRQRHHRGRNHVGRQSLGQRRTNGGRLGGPGHIPHQARFAGAVLAGDHHRLLHAFEAGQDGLHLSRLDAVSADFDLLVGAPKVLQLAVGAPAHEIAGAIHAGSSLAERTRNKSRPRQTRPA